MFEHTSVTLVCHNTSSQGMSFVFPGGEVKKVSGLCWNSIFPAPGGNIAVQRLPHGVPLVRALTNWPSPHALYALSVPCHLHQYSGSACAWELLPQARQRAVRSQPRSTPPLAHTHLIDHTITASISLRLPPCTLRSGGLATVQLAHLYPDLSVLPAAGGW